MYEYNWRVSFILLSKFLVLLSRMPSTRSQSFRAKSACYLSKLSGRIVRVSWTERIITEDVFWRTNDQRSLLTPVKCRVYNRKKGSHNMARGKEITEGSVRRGSTRHDNNNMNEIIQDKDPNTYYTVQKRKPEKILLCEYCSWCLFWSTYILFTFVCTNKLNWINLSKRFNNYTVFDRS